MTVDAYEKQMVGNWRGKGRSWQTISENLRKPVVDVRRHYDPTFNVPFDRPVIVRPEKPAPVKCGPVPGVKHRKRSNTAIERAILGRFYFSKGPTKLASLPKGDRLAFDRLRKAYGYTIADHIQHKGYVLSPSGRKLYETLVQGGDA